MADETPDNLTLLLRRMQKDGTQAGEEVLRLVYDDLRRIAGRLIANERPGHTLQPTALVNETYVRHLRGLRTEIRDRQHFFSIAGRAMRQVLVDHARKVKSRKRGDGQPAARLGESLEGQGHLQPETIIAVHEELERLYLLDARSACVIDLRYFLGCDWEETAEILETNVPSVRRDWDFAKAYLSQRLR